MSTILVRVFAILAGLSSSVALARVLGPEQYGVYSFVFALVTILSMPVKLGLPTLVVRETALCRLDLDWGRMRGVWLWSMLIALGGSAIIGIVAVTTLNFFPNLISTDAATTLYWALPLIPLLAMGNLRTAALRGLRRLFSGHFVEKVLRPFLLASFVLMVGIYLSDQLTSAWAMALHSLSALVVFLLGTLLLVRAKPDELNQCPTNTMKHREWFRAIIPLSLISGLQLISQNTDLMMLGFYLENSDVGLYKVALNGASLVVFGLTAVTMVTQPYIASLFAEQSFTKLQRLLTLSSRACLFLTIPVIAIIALYGRDIITLLFGGDYVEAYTALVILSSAQFVNAFFGAVAVLLSMSKNENLALRGLCYSTVANVALNAVLIPVFGIEGAAIATGFSIIFWNIHFWNSARTRLHLDSSPFGIFR